MAFTVIYDANVLYPNTLRDLLIRIAQAIVTSNLKDFPADELSEGDIEARSPDDFVLDQVGIHAQTDHRGLRTADRRLTHPPAPGCR
jgi:hypothetical protein